MQVNSGMRSVFAVAGLLLLAGPSPVHAQESAAQPSSQSLFRLFNDSGRVSVRSFVQEFALPLRSAQLGVHWNNERVTIPGISSPAGSQEAVDAITTASRPIAGNPYEDFVKTRNEITGDLTAGHTSASYYVSSESDYLAQQLGATFDRDFRDNQLNLAIGTSFGWDDIQPLRNAAVQAPSNTKKTLHWNAVATEVLSSTALLRVGVEYNIVEGLQHNPYRNVFAGGSHVPERHPSHRERRDAFVRFHQYFENRSSIKSGYRLYNDDWGITSHELGGSLSQYVGHDAAVTYEYRYYTQSKADFHRKEYETLSGVDGYLSGDYRMDALASHLFGASLRVDLQGLAAGHRLMERSALWLNYQRYFNSNNYSANILEAGLDFRFR